MNQFTKKEMIRSYPGLSQREKEDLIRNPWKLDSKPELMYKIRNYCENNPGLVKSKNLKFKF